MTLTNFQLLMITMFGLLALVSLYNTLRIAFLEKLMNEKMDGMIEALKEIRDQIKNRGGFPLH